ncbi:unnamed protein product, partial [marine sediment metagenome]
EENSISVQQFHAQYDFNRNIYMAVNLGKVHGFAREEVERVIDYDREGNAITIPWLLEVDETYSSKKVLLGSNIFNSKNNKIAVIEGFLQRNRDTSILNPFNYSTPGFTLIGYLGRSEAGIEKAFGQGGWLDAYAKLRFQDFALTVKGGSSTAYGDREYLSASLIWPMSKYFSPEFGWNMRKIGHGPTKHGLSLNVRMMPITRDKKCFDKNGQLLGEEIPGVDPVEPFRL